MQRIFFLFLLAFSFSVYSQTCDTANVSQEKYLQEQCKKYANKVAKGKSVSYKKADLLFELAAYLRQKKDSTYKAWYNVTCELLKKNFQRGYDKGADHIAGARHLYRVVMCYFYLEDYTSAVTFLSKAIVAKYNSPCAYYFISLSKRKQGRQEEADAEMNAFEEKTK